MKQCLSRLLQALPMLLTLSLAMCLFMSSVTSSYADSAVISKQQAVSSVQRMYPGRVLSVKLRGGVYRVKVLSERGEVRIVRVDAESGKIISRR